MAPTHSVCSSTFMRAFPRLGCQYGRTVLESLLRMAIAREELSKTWAVLPSDKYTRAVVELLTEAAKRSGSERVMAVVGGALLEEAVNRTLSERLVDDPRVIKNLLNPDRPLGNVAPQIDLLYLLGSFDDRTRKALKGLAGVRNFF